MKKTIILFLALTMSVASAIAQCASPTSAEATVTFKRKVRGSLAGYFSVSAEKQVAFSQGNLQYNSDTQKWQFAAHQYDYVGNASGNRSLTADGIADGNGIVDLFGWVGASSSWTGIKQYGVTSRSSAVAADGYGYTTSEALKSDWGNTMGDGWRTLTNTEWRYLLNTRSGDKAATIGSSNNTRYAVASINTDGTSVYGIIIFPDGGSFATSEFTSVGYLNQASGGVRCTRAQWEALETKGCVFLPAAGYRNSSSVSDAGSWGLYSSSNSSGSYNDVAPTLLFYSGTVDPEYISRMNFYCKRHAGRSVRLVRDAE